MGGGTGAHKRCGLTEQIIFILAIASGTSCSICSKVMMQMHGTSISGDWEIFGKPIFQTFGMFVGMLFGLVMHWLVVLFKIPFPGYVHETNGSSDIENGLVAANAGNGKAGYGAIPGSEEEGLANGAGAGSSDTSAPPTASSLPGWMYWFLMIPSIFDLVATALCMMGLVYLDVSVYILLRGSGIIFVALMKEHLLGDRLFKFQWVGVSYNVASVLLVGAAAILNSSDETLETKTVTVGESILGCGLVLAGAFVQALQFAFEEKVMNMEIPAPPLLLIGMEGFWGTVLCLIVVYPIANIVPGQDHGSYEDPFNTWYMIMHNHSIQWAFLIYFFTIFSYNLFAVMVTFLLNSVWHAILDNFRPATVWITDLLIFYVIAKGSAFGESWTKYSYIQVAGMFVLLYGTSVYNAPNPGSVKLDGSWYSLGINLQSEYDELEQVLKQQEEDEEWAKKKSLFRERTDSSFYGDRSPYIDLQTQHTAHKND